MTNDPTEVQSRRLSLASTWQNWAHSALLSQVTNLWQGGSVIRNLIEADRRYRLRGLTRDASNPAAQKVKEFGVDVVSVSISVGNDAAVWDAFREADIAFVSVMDPFSGNAHRCIIQGVTNLNTWTRRARSLRANSWSMPRRPPAPSSSRPPNVTKPSGGEYVHPRSALRRQCGCGGLRPLAASHYRCAGWLVRRCFAATPLSSRSCSYTTNLLNPVVGPSFRRSRTVKPRVLLTLNTIIPPSAILSNCRVPIHAQKIWAIPTDSTRVRLSGAC